MKKIILVCGILLYGGISLAQTPSVSTSTPTPKTETAVAPNDQDVMEAVEKNIDRRLAYFNRYKQTGDIESLSKLVSEKNKDFYTNFIKYVKLAPAFTLKRNATAKIVKTPSGEYFVPSILTVNGREKKVSVNFVEEKLEQGSKWMISNSTFHTQTGTANTATNLGSSSIDPKTGTKLPVTPKTTPTNVESKATPTLPAKKAPESTPQVTPPVSSPGMDIKTILIVSISIIILVGGGIGGFIYYSVLKKRKTQKILATATAAAATTFVAAVEATPSSTPMTVTPPVPAASNVTVSTVEEMHGTPSEKTLTENQASLAGENSPLTSPESDTDTSISQTMSEEAESMIATPPVEVFEATQETPTTTLNEPLPTDQEKESSAVLVENPAPETPVIEKPMADIFLTPSADPTETATVTPNEIVEKTPSQPREAHPLFEGMFDSVEPKTETLGNNTANNK